MQFNQWVKLNQMEDCVTLEDLFVSRYCRVSIFGLSSQLPYFGLAIQSVTKKQDG